MSNVFDRTYSLIIGRLPRQINTVLPSSIASPEVNKVPRYLASSKTIKESLGDISNGIPVDYRTIPESFIEIKDLSMKAKIVYNKSGSKGSNQYSSIELHNLSPETKNFIKENSLIFLRAGYKNQIQEGNYEDLPLLLSSQIISFNTKRSPDGTVVTTINCGDNILPKNNIKVSKSWPSNTSKRKVLNDLLDVARSKFIPVGKIFEIEGFIDPLSEVYPFGYSTAGNLFEELSKLADSIDYIFYTSLGKIYFEPKSSKRLFEFVTINPENLKQPVQKELDSANKNKGSKSSKYGVSITTFLNGNITTDKYLQIVNYLEDYNGDYDIDAVEHNLDFEGNNWDTKVKAIRI